MVDDRGWEGCFHGDWGYGRKRGSCFTSVIEKQRQPAATMPQRPASYLRLG